MRNVTKCLLFLCIVMAGPGCAELRRASTDLPPDDVTITTIIREEIASDPELKRQHITVVTRNGEVVLSGTVRTRAQETRIIKAALRVKGVRSVKDDITILKK